MGCSSRIAPPKIKEPSIGVIIPAVVIIATVKEL